MATSRFGVRGSANRYQFRVNGLIIPHIDVRHALVNGVPCGEWQIAIKDPVLGWITLDDNDNLWDNDLPQFVLEVRDVTIPAADHFFLPNQDGWYSTTIAGLLELFESTGVIIRETL